VDLSRRTLLLGGLAAGLSGCAVAKAPSPGAESVVEHPVVVRGGRVVDPARGLDARADVAIEDARIVAVAPRLRGRIVLDATGCIVAPGFIDLHSHAQTVVGNWLQAFDGVTTALELEAGTSPIAEAYTRTAAVGRPLNYGYSASWALARVEALTGVRAEPGRGALSRFNDPSWQREATAAEEDRMLGLIERELAAGALGIGVLLGFAPRTGRGEYLRVARLAAAQRTPTYTHARELGEGVAAGRADGAEELVRAAGETGAHMHYCHVNSTSGRAIDRVLALVDRARREGSVVTTEAYPYGAGMTGIGAAFLAPEELAKRGFRPSDIVCMPENQRVRDAEHLRELRAGNPARLCIVHFFDETKPADVAVMRTSLIHADTMVASDAMPLSGLSPGWTAWPLPPAAITHPRSAGTFGRAYRYLVGEGWLSLTEFIRRASVLPARVLEVAAGGTARKGTLAVGADADVVVFAPQAFRDRATYEASTQPSTGVRHLLVRGTPVIRDGALLVDARPGRPVRRS
jgi:N-acyl-D-aspartate/D-glutamate deacylase